MFLLMAGDWISYGVKMDYYRNGGNLPPLVMAHGFSDDGLCWVPVAKGLGQYDLVLVDFRGHGKSEASDEGYRLATMTAELVALIERLKLESPIILGHSMGAVTTLTLAGMFPDLPCAIILEDPPPFWKPSSNNAERNEFFHSYIDTVKPRTRDELLDSIHFANLTWLEEENSLWSDSKHRFSNKISNLISPGAVTPPNFPDILERILCPVLLITACPTCGAILTNSDVTTLQTHVPQLKSVYISNAGHSNHREQFVHYMDVVKTFLSNLT